MTPFRLPKTNFKTTMSMGSNVTNTVSDFEWLVTKNGVQLNFFINHCRTSRDQSTLTSISRKGSARTIQCQVYLYAKCTFQVFAAKTLSEKFKFYPNIVLIYFLFFS